MVPLIQILANHRLKDGHDPLCQFLPGGAVAQRGPIVWDFRQHIRRVTAAVARQINRQQNATGGASQFRRGSRRGLSETAPSFRPALACRYFPTRLHTATNQPALAQTASSAAVWLWSLRGGFPITEVGGFAPLLPSDATPRPSKYSSARE